MNVIRQCALKRTYSTNIVIAYLAIFVRRGSLTGAGEIDPNNVAAAVTARNCVKLCFLALGYLLRRQSDFKGNVFRNPGASRVVDHQPTKMAL